MSAPSRTLILVVAGMALLPAAIAARVQDLPTPAFHHVHLNSVDPAAAAAFYAARFPSTLVTSFAGEPALHSPTDVLLVFSRADTPPATQLQSAYWHFGWHVTDVESSLAAFRRDGVTLLPLYRERGGGTVFTSGQTWPSAGGGVGLTAAGIAEAKANGAQPTFGAGFAYLRGPDDAIVEYQGNMPAERFNHVHMFMEQPFFALLWYQRHLNVPMRGAADAARTEEDCGVERSPDATWPALDTNGTFRTPSMNSIAFGDVSLYAYMNQADVPLVGTRGQLLDHVALRVESMDAWIAKLRAEGVVFLEQPYEVGEYRAVMIEGPSREAIELIEIGG